MTKREFVSPLPYRMQSLPLDVRGFPVPAFVHWKKNGEPDFRVMDRGHFNRCVKDGRCWICGQARTRFMAFVIGPMCCVNRVSSEPPSHYECAEFAALNCPFLTRPLAKRANLDDLGPVHAAGIMIERNPGCCAVWLTKSYKVFEVNHPGAGRGKLIEIGRPERIEFYANGRRATRAEVEESVRTGIPFLVDAAARDGDEAIAEMYEQVARFQPLLERFAA